MIDPEKLTVYQWQELFWKYKNLLDSAKSYIKENYHETIQPEHEQGYETDLYLSRIKTAIWCLINYKEIPDFLSYQELTVEFDEAWVDYREKV